MCEDVAGFLNADLAHKVSNLVFDGEFAEDVDFRVVGFAVFDVKCLEIYFSVCQVDSRALVLESVCCFLVETPSLLKKITSACVVNCN